MARRAARPLPLPLLSCRAVRGRSSLLRCTSCVAVPPSRSACNSAPGHLLSPIRRPSGPLPSPPLPTLHPQVGGPGGAVLRDAPGQGIWFADALVVPLVPGKERTVKSKLGAFYARKPNTARHLYAEGAPVKGGARGTELASLHVWVAA